MYDFKDLLKGKIKEIAKNLDRDRVTDRDKVVVSCNMHNMSIDSSFVLLL